MPTTIGPFDNVPSPGDPLRSAWAIEISTFVNALGRGVVGYAKSSTAQAAIGTAPTDLTGLSVTWVASPTRIYLVQAIVPVTTKATAADVFVSISDGAGTDIQTAIINLAAGGSATFNPWLIEQSVSGSTTRKVRASCAGGTFTAAGAGNVQKFIAVIDLGPLGGLPTLLSGPDAAAPR